MLRELEYICTIWKEKSFTLAAEKLHISQPALSATVHKVEERIGVSLFDRTKKPIELTTAGEYYINSALQILNINNKMDHYFSSLSQTINGKVVIGASSFFCCYVLPPLIKEFNKVYPDIEVTLLEGSITDLYHKLQAEELDILVCIEFEINQPSMSYNIWEKETLLLSVPASFPINLGISDSALTLQDIQQKKYLSSNRSTITIDHFKNELFLSLPKGNDAYERLMHICEEKGFVPKISCSPTQQLTAFYMSKAEMGITFVREHLLHYVPWADDMFFYFIKSSFTERNVCIATKKNRNLPVSVNEFYNFMLTASI